MVHLISKINFFKNPSSSCNLFTLIRFSSTSSYFDFNLPIKNVELTTLKNCYKQSPNGLKFNVPYCDTKELNKKNVPTLLALHGSPGKFQDFTPYFENLNKKFEVRIIAPNFPGSEITDDYPFYLHKVEEKAMFLQDFLQKIDVNNIDLIMTHSSGVYPTLHLWNDKTIENNSLKNVKSFIIHSPPGHRTIRAMRPKWFTHSMGGFYRSNFGKKFLRKLGSKFLKLAGVNLNLSNIDRVFIACITMMHAKTENLEYQLKEIVKQELPLFLTFSEDDRLIEKEIFYEIIDFLNINKDNLVKYNKNLELTNLGNFSTNPKALVFEKGGHYSFSKNSPTINNYVDKFLSEFLKAKDEINDKIEYEQEIKLKQKI